MPGGTVYGAILEAGTTNLIANATAQSDSGALPIDYGNGAYTGSTTVEGTYYITASAPGYQDNTVSVELRGSDVVSKNIELTPV